MRTLARNRLRKRIVGLASLFAFLLFVVAAPFALGASDWPTWPPKKTAPAAPEPAKETISEQPVKEGGTASKAASNAGAAAGKSASAGISSGTLGWAAAIIGAGVLVGVAAGGGGGGSTSNH